MTTAKLIVTFTAFLALSTAKQSVSHSSDMKFQNRLATAQHQDPMEFFNQNYNRNNLAQYVLNAAQDQTA